MSFTIHARLNHPQAGASWSDNYCFDDPERHLIAEPLLDNVTAAIKELFQEIDIKTPEFISIMFGYPAELIEEWDDSPERSIVCALDYEKESSDGSVYMINVLYPDQLRITVAMANLVGGFHKATLCPMLMRYFKTPPAMLVARITASDEPGCPEPS